MAHRGSTVSTIGSTTDYTSHGIVHWFPQQALRLQTAADDSAKEKGQREKNGDDADEKKEGKQRVPLPLPPKLRTADGTKKDKNSSTFVAAADNVISGGEGGGLLQFWREAPWGGGRFRGGGGAMRFPIACSRKWVSFLVHTLHLTIITPP